MSTKTGIQEIIDSFISKSELDKEKAEEFARLFFTVIEEGLEKDRYVKIKGLGTFKLVDVENRESINVNTGERFEIQGHTKITFTPETGLRDLINKPFAHFQTVVLSDNVSFEDENKAPEEEHEQAEKVQEEVTVTPEAVEPEPEAPAPEPEIPQPEPEIPQPEPEAPKPEPAEAIAQHTPITKGVIVEPTEEQEVVPRKKSRAGVYIALIIAILMLFAVLYILFS